MYEEFARATMNEKFTRYQAEAREPKIKFSIFKRRGADRPGKVGAYRLTVGHRS